MVSSHILPVMGGIRSGPKNRSSGRKRAKLYSTSIRCLLYLGRPIYYSDIMLDLYLYSLDKMSKEAEAELDTLKIETVWQDNLPQETITLLQGGSRVKPEIRFDVSVLDWETKHVVDLKIRKLLRKHGIKFLFSNASNPKLNFHYGQKIITVRPM